MTSKKIKYYITFIYLLILCQNSSAYSWEGNGNEKSPFLISSVEQLVELADSVNAGNDYKDVIFSLVSDLDLSSVCQKDSESWTPIGSINHYFEGTFLGNDHTINNLFLEITSSYNGLFGYIGKNGKVSNLSIQDGYVYSSFWSGAIAGGNSGEISDCHNINCEVTSFQLSGGIVGGNFNTVKNCTNKADVSSNLCAGGIAGYNYGNTSACRNQGDIYGIKATGGIAGYNGGFDSKNNCYNIKAGIIQNCQNIAYVTGTRKTGGITGRNDGIILNSYNRGELNSNTEVGGIAGYNGGFDGIEGKIYNSYNIGYITCSESYAGGLVGSNNIVGEVTNSYNAGKIAAFNQSGSLLGENKGQINHCFKWENTLKEEIGTNEGFIDQSGTFTQDGNICTLTEKIDSINDLSSTLNSWVGNQQDSIFLKWGNDSIDKPSNNLFPIHTSSSKELHNVLVYNFHGETVSNTYIAPENTTITIKIVSEEGFILDSVVTWNDDKTIPTSINNNTISFIMPNNDVSVYFYWGKNEHTSTNMTKKTENPLTIYSKDQSIYISTDINTEIVIYSITGQLIRRFDMEKNTKKRVMLTPGMYLVNRNEIYVR